MGPVGFLLTLLPRPPPPGAHRRRGTPPPPGVTAWAAAHGNGQANGALTG
eukprot:gene37772-18728_t